jgi:hypothetical protein
MGAKVTKQKRSNSVDTQVTSNSQIVGNNSQSHRQSASSIFNRGRPEEEDVVANNNCVITGCDNDPDDGSDPTETQTRSVWHTITLDKELLYCTVTKTNIGVDEPICFLVVFTNYNSDLMLEKLQVVYNRYSNIVGEKTFRELCKNQGILKPPRESNLTGLLRSYDYRIMLRIKADDKIFVDGQYRNCLVRDMKPDKIFANKIQFDLSVNHDPSRHKKHSLTVQTGSVVVQGASMLCKR